LELGVVGASCWDPWVGALVVARSRAVPSMGQNLGAFDVPPAEVKVVLVEITSENVGLRGGQAACDVDLGYALQV
jgi:hypothetical protein